MKHDTKLSLLNDTVIDAKELPHFTKIHQEMSWTFSTQAAKLETKNYLGFIGAVDELNCAGDFIKIQSYN